MMEYAKDAIRILCWMGGIAALSASILLILIRKEMKKNGTL